MLRTRPEHPATLRPPPRDTNRSERICAFLAVVSRSALTMSDYRREEAINETRSRQTNEWIQEANDKFGAEHPDGRVPVRMQRRGLRQRR